MLKTCWVYFMLISLVTLGGVGRAACINRTASVTTSVDRSQTKWLKPKELIKGKQQRGGRVRQRHPRPCRSRRRSSMLWQQRRRRKLRTDPRGRSSWEQLIFACQQ